MFICWYTMLWNAICALSYVVGTHWSKQQFCFSFSEKMKKTVVAQKSHFRSTSEPKWQKRCKYKTFFFKIKNRWKAWSFVTLATFPNMYVWIKNFLNLAYGLWFLSGLTQLRQDFGWPNLEPKLQKLLFQLKYW